MLRIKVSDDGKTKRVLYLEGKLCKEWAGELKAEVEKGIEMKEKIILDFSGVTYIDEESARMINLLPNSKIEKRNGSLFIRTLLGMRERGRGE